MKPSKTLLAALAFIFVLPALGQSTVRHDVSAKSAIDVVTRVVVEVPHVHLTLVNGDAKTIDAYGYVTRSWRTSKQREKAQQFVDDSHIRIDIEGATAYVRRNHGPNAQSSSAKGSKSMYVLSVRVPADTSAVVRQKSGSITAKGRFGTIDFELSKGSVDIEIPKKNVGELIARTRWGHLEVHLGDRIIENEGLMPRKAHYFYEGGQNVLTALLTRGNISIRLKD